MAQIKVYPISEVEVYGVKDEFWLDWDNYMITLLEKHGVGIRGVFKTPARWGSTQFLVDLQIGAIVILSNRLCHDKDMNWYLEPAQLEDVPQYSRWETLTKPDWIYEYHMEGNFEVRGIKRGYRTVLAFPPKFWNLVEEAVTEYVMAMVERGDLAITEVDLSKIRQPGKKLYQKMIRDNELPGFEALMGRIDEEGHRRD